MGRLLTACAQPGVQPMQAAMAARRVVMSASFLNSEELRQIHPLALVIGLINSQAGKMYHAWGLRRLSCSDWIFTLVTILLSVAVTRVWSKASSHSHGSGFATCP